MLESPVRHAHTMPPAPALLSGMDAPLQARQTTMAVVNLRGNPEDATWLAAAEQALGMPLPLVACTTVQQDNGLRIIWIGPDEWQLVAPAGQQAQLVQTLRVALINHHSAVTDVSGGFFLVEFRGPQARDVLAQGCPMDLHPLAFSSERAVGTHFFKVGLTLWRTNETQGLQMLVRRSFIDHFWQLIDHACQSCGRTAF